MKTIAIAVLVALLSLAALVGTTAAVVSADVAQKAKDDAEAATHGATGAPSAHGLPRRPAAEGAGPCQLRRPDRRKRRGTRRSP